MIYDGIVIEENLERMKLDRAWLDKQLRSMKIKASGEVFLAALIQTANSYVDPDTKTVKTLTDLSDYQHIK